jgi:predicted lipid-binding transport protein (Tim44 family)
MRSLAGGFLGGMAGSLLFSSLGFGGMGAHGGGIGLMDILLLGAILYGIYWFIKKRRQAATAMNSPMSYGSMSGRESAFGPGSYAPPIQDIPPASGYEGGDGLSAIRRTDFQFDERRFKDAALDNFFQIQGAWAGRDMSGVRNLLTDEVYKTIQQDASELKAKKQINKLDNIAVRSVDITEAWQEGGQDFITVKFYANLLDYTVDEASGDVVSGSKTDPVKFVEFWTFSRPSGSGPWRLSAVEQES